MYLAIMIYCLVKLVSSCKLVIICFSFAVGCDVSSDGERISCDCKPGYYGGRCQSCAAGFFGRPEVQGESCRPCECSGNINANETGSCDSVNGDCKNCLHNTFGEACALCAPGYYGDAVVLKDCQTCLCDETGTERCDSYSGTCQCLPNVVGDKCDRCQIEHYGFTTGHGCKSCECAIASESAQCEDAKGQCRCKRGVTGRTCDHCAPGFWDYGPEGCLSCGCNTEYSLGFGCNAQTGQCECLPGVVGEKCDRCPYRWVLIDNEGCFGCDTCTHDLLDVTGALKNMTDPVIVEFDNVASGYFTSRRLIYINNTVHELKPAVNLLDPSQGNILNPLNVELEQLEQGSKGLNRKSNFSLENSGKIEPDAVKLVGDAIKMLNSIRETALRADDTVHEVIELTFDDSEGPKIEQAIDEANAIIDEIRHYDFTEREDEATLKLDKAQELLKNMKEFNVPVIDQWDEVEKFNDNLLDINNKINDILNYTQYTFNTVAQAEELNQKYRGDIVKGKINSINNQSETAAKELDEAHELITLATDNLANAHRATNKLKDSAGSLDRLNHDFNSTIVEDYNEIDPLLDVLQKANNHSEYLSYEVCGKLDYTLRYYIIVLSLVNNRF